jgi:hypothetical protein
VGRVFDTVLGLPVHVLVIHAVVVLVPLAALATAAVALLPARLARLGWLVVAFDTAMLAATFVAKESGEEFFRLLDEPQAAVRHTELGATMQWYVLALVVAAVLAVLVRSSGRTVLSAVVAVLVLVTAGATTVQLVRVGHSGSDAAWGGLAQD